ncbi:MAG: glycosyltransferase [Cyanobacteria bacterium J06638_22]
MLASSRHSKKVWLERVDVIHLPLMRADRNLFMNFDIAIWCIEKYPELLNSSNYIYYTHPDPIRTSNKDRICDTFNRVSKVFTMNSRDATRLVEMGVSADRVQTVLGGFDPKMFAPKKGHQGKKIAVIGAYYDRKNPDRLLALAKSSPDLSFLVISPEPEALVNKGLDWRNWEHFSDLMALPNIEFVEVAHAEHPALHSDIGVFLSLATMEGGPIPLLECLASGIPAVITPTGFAHDVVAEGRNGFLIPFDADDETIRRAIFQCSDLQSEEISKSVRGLSWSDLGKTIAQYLVVSFTGGETVQFSSKTYGQFLLDSGWHIIEPGGIWSKSKRATIRVPLEWRQAGVYQLTFRIWAFDRPDGKAHPVSVWMNDREVKRLANLGTNPEPLTIEVPAEKVSRYGEVIDFRCEELLCSSMLNPASVKSLGVRLGRLDITFVDGETEG